VEAGIGQGVLNRLVEQKEGKEERKEESQGSQLQSFSFPVWGEQKKSLKARMKATQVVADPGGGSVYRCPPPPQKET